MNEKSIQEYDILKQADKQGSFNKEDYRRPRLWKDENDSDFIRKEETQLSSLKKQLELKTITANDPQTIFESADNVCDNIKQYIKDNPGSPLREYGINRKEISNFNQSKMKSYFEDHLGFTLNEVTSTYIY